MTHTHTDTGTKTGKHAGVEWVGIYDELEHRNSSPLVSTRPDSELR